MTSINKDIIQEKISDMFKWPWSKKSGAHLGIDLGNYAIKIVELTKKEGRLHVSNYALAQIKDNAPFELSELKEDDISAVLKTLIAEAKIVGRMASVSLPVGKTFSTIIEMPPLLEKELIAAIPFEAQKYIPVPMDEVVLDWSLIPSVKKPGTQQNPAAQAEEEEEVEGKDKKKQGVQILVVAVPKDIISSLMRVAKTAGLEISALEQEAFSLTRSLLGGDSGTYLIVDLSLKGTDLILSDQGLVKISHNIDAVGKENVLMEIDRIVNLCQMKYNKKVNQCLLTGGRAKQKEILEFLESKLKMPVKIGNPFARISYLPILEPALKEAGPQLAVAVGLAMREN